MINPFYGAVSLCMFHRISDGFQRGCPSSRYVCALYRVIQGAKWVYELFHDTL